MEKGLLEIEEVASPKCQDANPMGFGLSIMGVSKVEHCGNQWSVSKVHEKLNEV